MQCYILWPTYTASGAKTGTDILRADTRVHVLILASRGVSYAQFDPPSASYQLTVWLGAAVDE